MTSGRAILVAMITVALCAATARAEDLSFGGRLSAWFLLNDDSLETTEAGVRYIPALSLGLPVGEEARLDAEFSADAHASAPLDALDEADGGSDVDPYRLWLRFSLPRLELRGGLQKINFGSAALLRPLMWFDRVDPRDPLELTDGVYGVLGRYYFLNNANVWVWGLTGNDETKGWEAVPSDEHKVEYGGRVQVPLFDGETALTYHHREAAPEDGRPAPFAPLEREFGEDRVAVDGNWDVGLGVWFEGVVVHQELATSASRYQRLFNVGLDYTFDLGNGLHVLAEHLSVDRAEGILDAGQGFDISAGSLDYPLGLIDQVSAIVYYHWDDEDWYSFTTWRRTYDHWSLNLSAFWSPGDDGVPDGLTAGSAFAGRGAQVMVVIDH